MSEGKTGHIFDGAMGNMEIGSNGVLPLPMLTELPDLEADQYLVFRCARAMTAKLALSRAKGRNGWHTQRCSDDYLRNMLREHLEKGDMVDVLNLAGMILVRQEVREQQASLLEHQVILGPTGNGMKEEKTGHAMAAMLASGEQCRINNSTD